MRVFRRIVSSMVCILILMCSTGLAADKKHYPTAPAIKAEGKKWRIGYLEGGPYKNYQSFLIATVQELAELGWIEKTDIPPQEDEEDTSKLWAWLAAHVQSKYIEFVPDAYWSNNWDDAVRKTNKDLLIKRLNEARDIDLMIAMGTWAGQDLANTDHSVPTIVCSVSNAVASQIVKSVEDSGYDHIHAHLDPTRYERQVRLFYDFMEFKKLGVAFEDTVAGRSYAAIEEVEKVAKEKNFEVVTCYTKSDIPSDEEAEASVIKCAQELASKVDAFYVTTQKGVTLKSLPRILTPLTEHKIPTFSQVTSEQVRYGVLLSIAQAGYRYTGKFHAETIAKIFNGAKPRDLDQVFEEPPKIAINLAEAKAIDWDPPLNVLETADEIYHEIEAVEAGR